MSCEGIHSWTLVGLLLAYVDLGVAYMLLCISAFAFLPSNFLSFMGIYLPCPCSGLFGHQFSNLCWNELLVEWPKRRISYVQDLVKSRFPFHLVFSEDHSCISCARGTKDCENGTLEAKRNACYSSFCSPSSLALDREQGYDAKGKKTQNQKQQSVIRRRRRTSIGYRKASSFMSSGGTHLLDSGVNLPNCDNETRSEISNNLDPSSGHLDGFVDNMDASTDSGGPHRKGKGVEEASLSLTRPMCYGEDAMGIARNDSDEIRIVKQTLTQERAAYAALYQELEKERAAAATAADETMAMISRLQEDKASVEMESKQYQRLIEEKFAYDEDEMDILKEILVRREREIHFLQKELEVYRRISISENEQLEGGLNYTMASNGRSSSLLGHSTEDLLLLPPDIDIGKSTVEENSEKLVENQSPVESYSHTFISDTESTIHDVHVVDDKTMVLNISSLMNSSSSAVGDERMKRDVEVEWLRERLRTVQEEKEKLNFSAENRERVTTQLRLMEEIVNQLRDIQHM